MGTLQDRLGAAKYEKYREYIKGEESKGIYNGNPKVENNGFGYTGAYQFGAEALQTHGLIKPGIVTNFGSLGRTRAEAGQNHTALMDNPNNWTIPGGKRAFLDNKALQDQTFDKFTEGNYQTLVKNGVIKPDTPPDQVAGLLGASHLLGAGTVTKKGVDGVDGLGTSGSKYYTGAAKAVNGSATAPPPPKPSKTKPGDPSKTPSTTAPYAGGDRKLKPSAFPNSVEINGVRTLPEEAIPLPQPNPLSQFVSFNSIITISCITRDAARDPLNSYKAGDIGEVVLRSSGAGAKAQKTALVTDDNPGGQYEFYIDNLEINSIMTFSLETQNTNATRISFNINEPYSMGLFLQSCEIAADKCGWPTGYLQAVFLLTIEFVGFDDEGIGSTIIPNTTRHIPFTFQNIEMSMKSSGAVYRATCIPSNEIALLNNFRLFESDVALSGKTVQEILQTGEFSLQTIVNKRLQEIAEKEKEPTIADEVVIIFPKSETNLSSAGKPKAIAKAAFTNADVYPPADKGATNKSTPTVKVSRKDSSSTLVQSSDTLNEIGLAKMDFDMTTSGESQVNKQDEVQSDGKKPVLRSKVKYDPKTRQFIYSQGSSLVNAISSVLLHTDYCKKAIEAAKVDKKGMINWFRIETQVDYQAVKPGNAGNNSIPKLLIYKIVPFKVHSEKLVSPSSPVKGYEELKNEAAKVYDFIYTGKNTEILAFDLEFKNAFFNTIAVDQNKLHKELFNSGQVSASTQPSTAPKTQDNTPLAKNKLTGNAAAGRNLTVDPHPGGTTADDYRTVVAKAFQRALYESQTDLLQANLTVMGDPYYLGDSGMGNFNNSGSGRFNITETGAMDYQSGDVDIIINFRTPLDYNQTTGIMDFGPTKIVEEFSGLYKVNFVLHRFNKGKFTQELTLMRRTRQSVKPIEVRDLPPLASGSEEIRDETGRVSSIRRNTETGELYDGTGLYDDNGKAIANPKSKQEVNVATTTKTNTVSPAMVDADNNSIFTGYA